MLTPNYSNGGFLNKTEFGRRLSHCSQLEVGGNLQDALCGLRVTPPAVRTARHMPSLGISCMSCPKLRSAEALDHLVVSLAGCSRLALRPGVLLRPVGAPSLPGSLPAPGIPGLAQVAWLYHLGQLKEFWIDLSGCECGPRV